MVIKKAVIPIVRLAVRIFTFRNAKLRPTANASILVAMESVSSDQAFGEIRRFLFVVFGMK